MDRRELLKAGITGYGVLGAGLIDYTGDNLDTTSDAPDVSDDSITELSKTVDEDAETVEVVVEVY